MKRILACVLAVLLTTSAANAAIISVPSRLDGTLTPASLTVPIRVSGGELIKSATICVTVTGGRISGLERQVGLFAGSLNVVDLPSIYTDSQGRSAVWSDYSLAFAQSAVSADGVIAILHIDTTGLAAGVYDILLSSTDGGDTGLGGPAGTTVPAELVNGWFGIYGAPDIPEPSALALLALGGLLIRRRTC